MLFKWTSRVNFWLLLEILIQVWVLLDFLFLTNLFEIKKDKYFSPLFMDQVIMCVCVCVCTFLHGVEGIWMVYAGSNWHIVKHLFLQ